MKDETRGLLLLMLALVVGFLTYAYIRVADSLPHNAGARLWYWSNYVAMTFSLLLCAWIVQKRGSSE